MEPGVKWTNLPLYSDVKNDGEGMQDLEVKIQHNQITNNNTIIYRYITLWVGVHF